MKKQIVTYKEDDDKIIQPVALLKFGELIHLKELMKNGTIYASSISEIRKKESNNKIENYRNDPFEGSLRYISSGPAKATFTTLKDSDGNPLSVPLINFNYFEKPELLFGNICSFYGITADSFNNGELIPVDERMKTFGSHFMLITNFDEFIKRVDKAIENTTKSNWQYGFVKYLDIKDYNNNTNLFKKRSLFSFQNEFRLHFEINNTSAIKINIGSIEDISIIISSDVLHFLKMNFDMKSKLLNINWLKEVQ